MTTYDFERIERKWQKKWLDSKAFEVREDPKRPKYYVLEMLPYPSGNIHMGHVRNYSIGDAVARFKRMRGFNVLHPIGWDALGLPAENAALKNQKHPEEWTLKNIEHMRTQLKRMGFSYAWSREFATCDPQYYRFNQWFFIQMWKKGLAYRKMASVNWCPDDKTVLANEQVIDGRCWRCDAEVVQKELEQWFLKITDYADELLAAMESMDRWPGKVLTLQKNWIGRSEGAEIDFAVPDVSESIRVFTTRVDTIYGATFVVLAPEHPLAARFASTNPEVASYVKKAQSEDKDTRLAEDREKTGIATGHDAVNPFNGESVPIWVADYVLMDYGTGAVMAVPAHDERDFAFAKKYGLTIRPVVQSGPGEDDALETASSDYGTVVDSGEFTGLPSKEAITAMTAHAVNAGFGKAAITYRIRDWGISRQRYWGTPIPMIYCGECGVVPVPESELPVVLPRDVTITGTGGSALGENEDFVNAKCPECGGVARRETDTMDTFVDSSWYFYRYVDPKNEDLPFSPEAVSYWFPIDLYIGGIEHAILHLIYCRFWTRMMRDLGLVEIDEPVTTQLSQGMVIKDGAKMSKNKGNVVDPEMFIAKYGADTVRIYMLFEAPPEKEINWTDQRLEGPSRFLQRVWRFVENEKDALGSTSPIEGNEEWAESETALRRKTHQTIMRVTRDIEQRLHFNTAISAIMELVNELYKSIDPRPHRSDTWKVIRQATETVILLLSPFAPHIAEELWQILGNRKGLTSATWPVYDRAVAAEDTITLVVQVNGKVRSRLTLPANQTEDEVRRLALEDEKIQGLLDGMEIKRVVVVPNRLVNVVVVPRVAAELQQE
ncbi:MAG: leucine--tRNA ligase [Acidobacteria bacterium]|nr:MAG: leucine--tRNA ligase [Acidobacteriota bacterium]